MKQDLKTIITPITITKVMMTVQLAITMALVIITVIVEVKEATKVTVTAADNNSRQIGSVPTIIRSKRTMVAIVMKTPMAISIVKGFLAFLSIS